jgi:NADH:ubiquinone oxidoreductase subunit 6 (subunit J)
VTALLLPAALAIIGAVYALAARQLMRGVLGLALFFIGIAGLFAHLGAWYLAIGQLILFLGGVVTLFVLAFNFTKTPEQERHMLSGSFIFVAFLTVLVVGLPLKNFYSSSDFTYFSQQLFLQHGWVLNIGLLLLFSAIIGAQYLMEEAA